MLSRTVSGFVSSLLASTLLVSIAYSAGSVASQARSSIMATAYVEPSLGLTEATADMSVDFTFDSDKNLYWLYHPNLDGVEIIVDGDLMPLETEHFQSYDLVSLISLSPVEPDRSVTVTLIYTDN